MNSDDKVTRHLFTGFIRLHVLYHAAKEPIFGAEIAEELARHGYRVSQGTLYPTLHLLTDAGYLRCTEKPVAGRIRKYYVATAKGKEVLKAAKAQLAELASEVLEDHDKLHAARRKKERRR